MYEGGKERERGGQEVEGGYEGGGRWSEGRSGKDVGKGDQFEEEEEGYGAHEEGERRQGGEGRGKGVWGD